MDDAIDLTDDTLHDVCDEIINLIRSAPAGGLLHDAHISDEESEFSFVVGWPTTPPTPPPADLFTLTILDGSFIVRIVSKSSLLAFEKADAEFREGNPRRGTARL